MLYIIMYFYIFYIFVFYILYILILLYIYIISYVSEYSFYMAKILMSLILLLFSGRNLNLKEIIQILKKIPVNHRKQLMLLKY